MAEVTARKRGSSWSYSFEMARINGKRKRKEKGGFRIAKAMVEVMYYESDMLIVLGSAACVLAIVSVVKCLCRRYGSARRLPRGGE